MNTDSLGTLYFIIPVISGILAIILFFKMWKMCDNVTEITNMMRKKINEEEKRKIEGN